ncbi:hypothetical protein DER45DRAFT_538821 [Fusarium avenaceum]|nr:hypothetical protein DER45DRAFT_538821 [Fusarium avenaceum]
MTAGVWFQTGVKFRGVLQPIDDVFRGLFAQGQPGLHLSAYLGVAEAFSDELLATGFIFRGTIEGYLGYQDDVWRRKKVGNLVKSDIYKNLEFSINTKWSFGGVPVELSGHIRKDRSSLRVYIQSLTMDDLRKLFNSLTGSHLEPTEQDIKLKDLTLGISEGRIALYGEVCVDGRQVAKAEVLVTVDGLRITSSVDDLDISDGVKVRKAQLELIVGDVNKPLENKGDLVKGQDDAKTSQPASKEAVPISLCCAGSLLCFQYVIGSITALVTPLHQRPIYIVILLLDGLTNDGQLQGSID